MRLQSAAFINSKTDLHCRIQLRGQIKKLYPLYKSTTELFSSLRNNTQLSFGWFSAFFALFIQKVQQFTVRIEFCLSSLIKKPFEFFWFTQTTFFVHQKNSKGFLFEMTNSHCFAMKLNSHSALLNLLDSQCKTTENQPKLAVYFSFAS